MSTFTTEKANGTTICTVGQFFADEYDIPQRVYRDRKIYQQKGFLANTRINRVLPIRPLVNPENIPRSPVSNAEPSTRPQAKRQRQERSQAPEPESTLVSPTLVDERPAPNPRRWEDPAITHARTHAAIHVHGTNVRSARQHELNVRIWNQNSRRPSNLGGDAVQIPVYVVGTARALIEMSNQLEQAAFWLSSRIDDEPETLAMVTLNNWVDR